MKKTTLSGILAAACVCCGPTAEAGTATPVKKGGDPLAAAVSTPVLPRVLAGSSESIAMRALIDADIAVDESWRKVKTKEEFFERQRKMREAMHGSLGAFPPRTPLRSRVTGTLRTADGIRIEKVLFESQPGFFVSGNVYLPAEKPGLKPPYPAILVPCGHSKNGKAHKGYQYGGLIGARSGFVTLVFDPVDQGERVRAQEYIYWRGHNWAGALCDRLGWSFARIRLWDAIRALDYLCERDDVDPDRLCVNGISGGGTATALVMAFDDRVKAAAPACYISTLHDTFDQRFPSDAEQEHFGQLAHGFSHLGYMLLRAPSPVLVCCTVDDCFPYKGTLSTFAALNEISRRFGWEDRFAMMTAQCDHRWPEGTRIASIDWFRKWVNGEKDALKEDLSGYLRENVGMLYSDREYGFVQKEIADYFPDEELFASPGGQVHDLPGARSMHDLLKDELDRQLEARKGKAVTSETVARLAGIRTSGRPACETFTLGTEKVDGVTVEKLSFFTPDNSQIPAALLLPEKVSSAPVIVVSAGTRAERLGIARERLVAGSPVLLPDLCGWGEIGKFRRKFSAQIVPDETLAMTWYPVGKMLVGIRAENLLDCADYLAGRFSARPLLVAEGRAVIPAVHAAFVSAASFSGPVEIRDAPASWADEVRTGAKANVADSVHGALRHYDWPDLVK